MQLFEALSMHVAARREDGYKHEAYPAIAEILEWARQPDVPNFRLRLPINRRSIIQKQWDSFGINRERLFIDFDRTAAYLRWPVTAVKQS